MNPIVSDFLGALVKEIARQVAEHITANSTTPAPGAEDIGKAATFKPDVVAERSEAEWRADCLAVINEIAPTHGPQLRKLFADFNAKRLPELAAEVLPAFLAELVALKDAD